MPTQQGEVSLSTLFADIHYVFSPPHVKPPHHRFDKTSYVYLYHNPIQRRGRLEVANYAGTPEQDAFVGYLDRVRIERSHKHPTLFTIIVDGAAPQGGSAGSTPQADMSQWHLPAPDQRGEGKYTYRLHTVEMYFWTVEDSEMFLDSLKRVVHENQLRLLDAPQSQQSQQQHHQQQHPGAVSDHRQSTISPVVQKLEQVAISKPYQGQGRTDSISTTHSFPGPPTAPTPSYLHASSPSPPVEAPGSFAPMAYNPAAPAAPEPIAHRDPTPPPPDAEHGTGLVAAAAHDHGNQFAPPHLQHQGTFPQQTGQQPYMPGPPQYQGAHSFSPPPSGTPIGVHRTNTNPSFPPPPPQSQSFAPPPQQAQNTGTPPQGMHQQQQPQQAYGGYPSQQFANYPGSPGPPGHPPVQSPGFPPVQSPGFPPVPGNKPAQSPGQAPTPGFPPQPSPGVAQGGYSQYNYAQNSQPSDPYAVHQQAYRPTESENAHHKPAQPGQKPGRFETGAKKFEKGVGGFLKKLDKKF